MLGFLALDLRTDPVRLCTGCHATSLCFGPRRQPPLNRLSCRAARDRLGKRPWALDNFDAFAARIMSAVGDGEGRVWGVAKIVKMVREADGGEKGGWS
mgnify:CR=1 FL=1